MKQRYSEKRINGFSAGWGSRDRGEGSCCKHGFSGASSYLWKSKFGGMSVLGREAAQRV